MTCPLCGQRKARRSCPALGHQICAVCCGTKRLTLIKCPSDCGYLVSAREHPAAAVVRQQQRDVGLMVRALRDLTQTQARLFLAVTRFIARYQTPDLQPLLDLDVGEAATALASTLETSARGVIYEHRPPSLPAERLAAALKALFEEAGRGGGSAFERDAAIVLRRVEEAVGEASLLEPDNRRSYLDLLGRLVRKGSGLDDAPDEAPEAPRLILP